MTRALARHSCDSATCTLPHLLLCDGKQRRGGTQRSYDVAGSISVDHHVGELLVVSPGRLLPSAENRVLTASISRNDRLASALRRLGLADQAGPGVDVMTRELLRRGHPRPSITSDDDTTRCYMVGGPPDPVVHAFTGALTPDSAMTAELMLTIERLRRRPWVTAESLAGVLERPADEVERLLDRWQREVRVDGEPAVERRLGLVTLTDTGRARLLPRVDWLPATRDSSADAIVALAHHQGRIARDDVVEMFDISEQTASRWLASLVTDGELVVGVAAGRNAHYVPVER